MSGTSNFAPQPYNFTNTCKCGLLVLSLRLITSPKYWAFVLPKSWNCDLVQSYALEMPYLPIAASICGNPDLQKNSWRFSLDHVWCCNAQSNSSTKSKEILHDNTNSSVSPHIRPGEKPGFTKCGIAVAISVRDVHGFSPRFRIQI